MSEVVDAVYSRDGNRRVLIERRADGAFCYREEYHYKNDQANVEGWADLGGCYASRFATLEIAMHELPYNFMWIAAERCSAENT
jgi:hypothetical protein